MRPIVFTHIPKTAGSTVHNAAKRLVGTKRWFLVRGVQDIAALRAMSEQERNRFRYIGGHIPFADARSLFPHAHLITAFREPIARLLSHYFFVLREGGLDIATRNVRREGFLHFYKYLIQNEGLTNLQCHFIGGAPDHRAALGNLQYYDVVWEADRTNETWPHIHRLMSIRPGRWIRETVYVAPHARNDDDLASGYRPQNYDTFLEEDIRETVLSDNRADVNLYEALAHKLPVVTPQPSSLDRLRARVVQLLARTGTEAHHG